MNDGLFHFKHFSVAHSRSSMKVGVDGVLVGAWADCQGDSILDVGTGCGLIALMMAQRNPIAKIMAIDVDERSVAECDANFRNSPWPDRLEVRKIPYSEIVDSGIYRFDRIVSNPPFFDSGVTDFSTSRNVARHQGELSPSVIISTAPQLLTDAGKLAMIVPSEFCRNLIKEGLDVGLHPSRVCLVRGNPRKLPKRVLLEFSRNNFDVSEESLLTLFDEAGNPTEEYLSLCHDFYLKF